MPLRVSCKARISLEYRENGPEDMCNNISAKIEHVRKELSQFAECPSSNFKCLKVSFYFT